MILIEIAEDGTPASPIADLPDLAHEVMSATRDMYKGGGYSPPWVGFLAVDHGKCVGTCAFKGAPVDGRVEIAYFTFPGNEGRGVASSMARRLVEIALRESPGIRICAQTMPLPNASTRVLEKAGFRQTRQVEHPEDGTVWERELMGSQTCGSRH